MRKQKHDRIFLSWEVDDGYVGGSAPQTTALYFDDILDCETLDEAVEVAEQAIEDDFRNKANPYWDGEKLREQVEELWKMKEEKKL